MEQTYGSDTTPDGWVMPVATEPDPDPKPGGLNGIHMDSLLRVLNKLDKVVERDGTHIIDEAKFAVYDGNGEAVTVLVGFNPELSLHYFIGIEA